MEHKWVIEEVDCGNLGTEDFWVCTQCKASGGLAYNISNLIPSVPEPFVNGRIGGPLNLPNDCQEAVRMISEYWAAKTVAVYGGSFNPVTWGHVVAVINFFLTNQILDEVLVVPCFQQEGKDLIDFHHRYKMCQLAFAGLNRVSISDVEFVFGGESHTGRLVQHLKEQNHHWNLRFVLGADLKESYKTWDGVEIIDAVAPPLIVPRPGFSKTEEEYGNFLNVSSTLVRSSLRAERYDFLERALPAAVLNYIKENNLYR